MAALVLVLMVPVYVGVLVGVSPGLMGVFVPVMAMGAGLVGVLMLMLVFVVATHLEFTSLFFIFLIISISPFAVNGNSARGSG